MRKIIGSLDIGNNSVKLIIGEFFNDKINILCALDEETKCFRDNTIINEEEFIKSVKQIVNSASDKLGFKVKKLIINIPVSMNNFIISETSNTITGDNKTVTSSDILKVLQSSAYNKVGVNDELIGVMPVYFRVGDNETMDPFGKKGKTISTKTVLVTAPKNEVHSIINVLEKCDIEIVDITTTAIVDYFNFKTSNYDLKTGIIVNIGDYQTNLSVFSKGIIINNEVLQIGGALIDNDISFIYKFNKDDSKFLKESLALANIRRANPKEQMRLVNLSNEELVINQYELTEIVASRVQDMLKLIKKSINHLTKKEISYIIITGGLTELKDFSIAIQSEFGEKVQIGNINTVGIRDNKYSVSLGMIKYFNEKLRLRHREYSTISESDEELMCNVDSKVMIASDSILGKVFGYFFDN